MSTEPDESTLGVPEPGDDRTEAQKIFGISLTTERIVRILIAVGLVVVSLFTDRQFLIWGLIASLVVVFVPRGKARYFVAGIVPYATAWFVFSFLRSFADETIFAKTLNTEVVDFERWLFNGEIPTIRMQAQFYTVGEIAPWDYYFTFVHWSYFIVPHALALWIWWRSKRDFQHYLAAMTMTLFLGLVIYTLIPTNPPWMAPEVIDSPGAPVVQRIMEPIAMELGGGLYQAGYKIVGESNPIAAMPSMHFGVTFLLVWAARGRGLKWEILAWVYALSMGAALVYMGEHYVIDIIVGGMVTTFSWYATKRWFGEDPDEIHATPVAETKTPVAPAGATG